MTFINVFEIFQTFIHDDLCNVSKVQQSLQINCKFATLFIRFALNIFVLKTSLQFLFCNKRAIIDFVNFSLFSIKRIRLISLVRKIRDRKFSTFCVSANLSVNIRVIQSIIIKYKSLKKRKNKV